MIRVTNSVRKSLCYLRYYEIKQGSFINKNQEEEIHHVLLSFEIKCARFYALRPRPHHAGEIGNGVFTLKTHQMFSVHTTPVKFENATFTGHVGTVFEENSGREISRNCRDVIVFKNLRF